MSFMLSAAVWVYKSDCCKFPRLIDLRTENCSYKILILSFTSRSAMDMEIENDDDERKTNDSFYDTDRDEELAEAANRSIYDASNPYVPICKTGQTEAPATTLSGRPLGATTYEEISKSIMKSMEETFVSDRHENEENISQKAIELPTKQSVATSFVRASFFYKDAKEKVNKEDLTSQQDTNQGEENDDSQSMMQQ